MSFINQAIAQAPNAAQVAPSPIAGFLPIIIIFVIFYFLLIRPQQKKVKAHQEMINAVKKGDVVITSGGVLGKIEKVLEEDLLQVKIAENVTIQILKSTIANVTTKKFAPVKTEVKKTTTAKKTTTKKAKK